MLGLFLLFAPKMIETIAHKAGLLAMLHHILLPSHRFMQQWLDSGVVQHLQWRDRAGIHRTSLLSGYKMIYVSAPWTINYIDL